MVNYRRVYVPGGTYFFTIVTGHRQPILIQHIDTLREAFRKTKKKYPFSIEAVVVLPDHLHTIWKLPANDSDFSLRWRLIKRSFSNGFKAFNRNVSKLKKQEKGIWQRRFWEHLIRDDNDLRIHFDYIHYNPVKHGLVMKPADWEYSSFEKCVTQGFYKPNWGSTEPFSLKGMKLE